MIGGGLQHFEALCPGIGFNLMTDLVPADVGQTDIEQYEIRMFSHCRGESVGAILGLENVIALPAQQSPLDGKSIGVVVYDQNRGVVNVLRHRTVSSFGLTLRTESVIAMQQAVATAKSPVTKTTP